MRILIIRTAEAAAPADYIKFLSISVFVASERAYEVYKLLSMMMVMMMIMPL